MNYPKLPIEKNRRRKLLQEDIEQIRWLVKEGTPRKDVAQQFKVSAATIDFWCWTDEQRKRHYERNKQRAKERGYPYDPKKVKAAQKEYRIYKKKVHGTEVIKQFKYEQSKQARLERAVELLRQHGREWLEKRYKRFPNFLKEIYNYRDRYENES